MLLYYVWLAELKNVTLLQKHRLLEQLGDPKSIYYASQRVLREQRLTQQAVTALENKDLSGAELILRRCKQKGIGILPVTDRAYPKRLRHTPDAPVVLYYKGKLPDWDSLPFIGIVGTRKASPYGLQVAYQMGKQIAACGGYVVSGCAAGGDAAAMQGALEAGCPVIGVLGCGVDMVYPLSNRKLFAAVAAEGCLLSEYPPGAEPLKWHFPQRNRIISGVSNGVLVVEAPERSGALITARYALEQGRDVYAVPGNINTPTCAGSNLLLQEGAMPVFTGWDVLCGYEILYPGKLKKHKEVPLYAYEQPVAKVAEKGTKPAKIGENGDLPRKKFIDKETISPYSVVENAKIELTRQEQAVYAALTGEPQEPAALIARLEMPAGSVLSALTMLTVKGLAQKHPGGRISKK